MGGSAGSSITVTAVRPATRSNTPRQNGSSTISHPPATVLRRRVHGSQTIGGSGRARWPPPFLRGRTGSSATPGHQPPYPTAPIAAATASTRRPAAGSSWPGDWSRPPRSPTGQPSPKNRSDFCTSHCTRDAAGRSAGGRRMDWRPGTVGANRAFLAASSRQSPVPPQRPAHPQRPTTINRRPAGRCAARPAGRRSGRRFCARSGDSTAALLNLEDRSR